MLNFDKLSFWEKNEYFSEIDALIIGAGIVGLSCALELKTRFPNKKILIIERSYLPAGASTKNAGFTCFGSASELLDDLQNISKKEIIKLIKDRYDGLKILRSRCGDANIDYQENGSFEIFKIDEKENFDFICTQLNVLNTITEKAIGKRVFSIAPNNFGFKNVSGIIKNELEGQIDTGKMMTLLHQKAINKGVKILNGLEILDFENLNNTVEVKTNYGNLFAKELFIATNGFSHNLISTEDIKPARAQVIITKPIHNLKLKGTFHYDKGYFYFRNIGNRILLGGGRNLDLEEETTTKLETSELITTALKELLTQVILPNTQFEIEQQWAGIMGVGKTKQPIVKSLYKNVHIGIRMGGMGVALGSLIGKKLSEL